MKRHRNMFQMKETAKTPGQGKQQQQQQQINEMIVSNLPGKEFKPVVMKMLIKLRRGVEEQSENFNRELENVKKELIIALTQTHTYMGN